MRDNQWLGKQLDFLLKNNFSDVPLTNPIEIRFGREAKFRFGSIKLVSTKSSRGIRELIFGFPKSKSLIRIGERPKKSVITITSMFAAESVPADVVRYTIAHELCHYAHGFSSTNKKLFRHPHHGGVVNQELKERGAEHLTRAFKRWLREYRKKILAGRAV